jgi:hypothetical protein
MTEGRARRRPGRAVSRTNSRGVTVVSRAIVAKSNPVRADGPVHLTYCSAAPEERHSLLLAVGLGRLQSIGHRYKITELRTAETAYDAVEVAEELAFSRLGRNRPDRILGALLLDTLEQLFDLAIDRLGANSEFPSADHLE